jgi:hypothetical protein
VTSTYSWQRCTSATSPYNCTTISGATNSSYVLTGDDSGLYRSEERRVGKEC